MGVSVSKKEMREKAFRLELTAEQLSLAVAHDRNLLKKTDAAGDPLLVIAVRTGNLPYVTTLLDLGAPLNVVEAATRSTLVAIAVRERTEAVLSLLLSRGAPIAADARGWTPLHVAASIPNNRACFDLLSAPPSPSLPPYLLFIDRLLWGFQKKFRCNQAKNHTHTEWRSAMRPYATSAQRMAVLHYKLQCAHHVLIWH